MKMTLVNQSLQFEDNPPITSLYAEAEEWLEPLAQYLACNCYEPSDLRLLSRQVNRIRKGVSTYEDATANIYCVYLFPDRVEFYDYMEEAEDDPNKMPLTASYPFATFANAFDAWVKGVKQAETMPPDTPWDIEFDGEVAGDE